MAYPVEYAREFARRVLEARPQYSALGSMPVPVDRPSDFPPDAPVPDEPLPPIERLFSNILPIAVIAGGGALALWAFTRRD